MSHRKLALGAVLIGLALSSCDRSQSPSPEPSATPTKQAASIPKLEGDPRPTLLLSKAQFSFRVNAQGRRVPVPGHAKLVLLRKSNSGWEQHILEDPTSLVFHKAMPFAVDDSEATARKILTIGGSEAALKIWDLDASTSTTHWNPAFGGQWDRLRDIEIGDVTGDGQDELIVATHDRGVIGVLERDESDWRVTELNRTESRTFVHEIEVGDIDGDGLNEFFATPSKPNLASGESQSGEIVMYRYHDGAFDHTLVDTFPDTHAKEILAFDANGDGTSILLAALEARTALRGRQVQVISPVVIREYRWQDDAFKQRDIATLDDRQCRFLCAGDVNGDNRIDVVASGMNSGVWLLQQANGEWTKTLIDADSSAYEHATLLVDSDGDGVCETYVAADRQQELRCYRWKDGGFQREVIATIPNSEVTFHVGFARL